MPPLFFSFSFFLEIVALYYWLIDPGVSMFFPKYHKEGNLGGKKKRRKKIFCYKYVKLCVFFLKTNMTQESKLNLILLILNLQVQVGIHSTLQKCFPTVDKLLTFCSYFVLNGHLLRKCSMASVLTACVNTSYNKL